MIADKTVRTQWYRQNGIDKIINQSTNDSVIFYQSSFHSNLFRVCLSLSCDFCLINIDFIIDSQNCYHFVRTILSVPFCPKTFCPYHFVRTISSKNTLSVYHFGRSPLCPHSIMSVSFCPLPIFLVTICPYLFVRTILSILFSPLPTCPVTIMSTFINRNCQKHRVVFRIANKTSLIYCPATFSLAYKRTQPVALCLGFRPILSIESIIRYSGNGLSKVLQKDPSRPVLLITFGF